jgi:hypothetical protein
MSKQALREYWFPVLLAVLIFIGGSIPYIYGYYHAEDGDNFMGFIGRGTVSANSYLMISRQYEEGHNLALNLHNTEINARNYFHFEWWAFGKFARWTGLSLITTFHVWRFFSVLGYLLAVYYLAAAALDSVFKRRLAVSLICFTAGFGWICYVLNSFGMHLYLPLDVRGVGPSGYLINNPHFIRSNLFVALLIAFLLRGEETGQWRYFVYAGIAATLASMMRPFHIPGTYGLCILFPLLRCYQQRRMDWKRIGMYLLVLIVHTPIFLWHFYVWKTNPLGLSHWIRQSEFFLSQVLWLGLPFTAVAVYFLLRGFSPIPKARPAYLLLGLWLFLAVLCEEASPYYTWAHESMSPYVLASPILAVALPFPWIFHACCNWAPIKNRFPNAAYSLSLKRILACALILACAPSTLIVYRNFFVLLERPHHLYYCSDNLMDSFSWVEEHTEPGTTILATPATSQYVTRFMDRKVLATQDILTPNFRSEEAQMRRFFRETGDAEFKRAYCRNRKVDYVIYGKTERNSGPMNPDNYGWLKSVYKNDTTTIYAVGRSNN